MRPVTPTGDESRYTKVQNGHPVETGRAHDVTRRIPRPILHGDREPLQRHHRLHHDRQL